MRHDRYAERYRLYRGPVQLERRSVPNRRPARQRSNRGAHPDQQHRSGPLRHPASLHREPGPLQRGRLHPRRRGPSWGRGFAILEPVADGINNAIIGPSAVLGAELRAAFAAGTGEPVSSYNGVNGIQPRADLAGTNLSTVPKVFIECANMRNAADATLVTTASWQATAARAIAAGLTTFLKEG